MMNIKITGLGIVCAIGNDAPSVLKSLREKKGGVAPIKYLKTDHMELPAGEIKLSNDEMKQILGIDKDTLVSRTTLMGAISLRQAVADADVDLTGKKVAVISGTTVGGMDITEQYFQKMKTDDSLLHILDKHDCGPSTRDIVDLAGLKGAEVITISTACSSALNSIMVGSEMLRSGEADIVFAGGAEGLSKFHLNGFNTLMILDQEQCRPFDKTRAGLNLGEGAAFVALQREDDAKHSYAYVRGYGNRCDAFHQTASSDDGEGAYLAMTDALRMAGMKPEDIQYINAHGTGTPNNDPSESVAIRRVFGEQYPLVSSTKGFTGHTTSASGSIETVISILAMQNDFVPASYGWKEQDEACIVPTQGVDNIKLENVLCNSFGFGGNDSSLIISSLPPASDAADEAAISYESKVVAESVIDDEEQLKDYREFISPMEARRMGKLMKAVTLTSMRALKAAGIECPDAIIASTAQGMLETSVKFLDDIDFNGEQLLKPTLFMQSTHNTLGSSIAIRTKCHGYNITFTHEDKSFELALRDAERLIATGKVNNVLVGYHEESIPLYQDFARRQGRPVPQLVYSKSVVLVRK